MRISHKKVSFVFAMFVLSISLAANAFAQQPPPRGDGGPPRGGPEDFHGPFGEHGGPGGPGGASRLRVGPPGRWWNDQDFIQKLSLTPDQQKKMDDIFNASRLKLIDLFAGVQKEEVIMEPLVAADPPDENKVLAQIDRVAQARAELEKANARMLLALRGQLTHEQWLKLDAMRPPMHRGPGFREGGQHRGGEPGSRGPQEN